MIFRNNPLRLKAKFRIIKVEYENSFHSYYSIQRRVFFRWYVNLQRWLEFFQYPERSYIYSRYSTLEEAKSALNVLIPAKVKKEKKRQQKHVVVFETS